MFSTLILIIALISLAISLYTRYEYKNFVAIRTFPAPKVVEKYNPPKCQFCGNTLSKVVKTRDGYMCCSRCAATKFSQVG